MGKSLIAIVVVAIAGCLPLQQGAGSAQGEPTDAELQQGYGPEVAGKIGDIRTKHKAALAAPTDPAAANAYADALIAGLQANYNQVNRIDWTQYAKDAAQVLQASSANAAPEVAADAMIKRAALLSALGDTAGATQAVKDGFAKSHTYLTGVAMVGVYRTEKKSADAQALCEKTRPMAKSEDDVYKLISECLQAVEEKDTAEHALPWAAAEDIAMYKQRAQEEADRRLAQRQAEEQRDAEMRQQEANRASEAQNQQNQQNQPGSNEPGSSGPVSFSMRNSCHETVKLFYGKTPKYGSGHTDSMSGNSVHSEMQQPGTMIWIIDDSENGIASFSVSQGIHELEIGPSCTSFMAH
jgi:hypothetical protein